MNTLANMWVEAVKGDEEALQICLGFDNKAQHAIYLKKGDDRDMLVRKLKSLANGLILDKALDQ